MNAAVVRVRTVFLYGVCHALPLLEFDFLVDAVLLFSGGSTNADTARGEGSRDGRGVSGQCRGPTTRGIMIRWLYMS